MAQGAFFETDGDADYAEEFVREYDGEVFNFCGRTSLMDLVGIFERSNLFVTVDTGTLHIAATTNVPIVAMYGCGPSKRWPPLTEDSRCVKTNEECSPCHIQADACPTNLRPKCQWNITRNKMSPSSAAGGGEYQNRR